MKSKERRETRPFKETDNRAIGSLPTVLLNKWIHYRKYAIKNYRGITELKQASCLNKCDDARHKQSK